MADEKIKISELDAASQSEFTDDALLALDVEDQNSATGYSTKSGLLSRLIAYIKTKLGIEDLNNVNITTSDNNKLLGVSVANNVISVGAVEMVTTGTITAGTGVTLTQSSIKKYGNVVTLGFKVKISSPTRWATILNFNSDFAPVGDYVYFSLDNTGSSTGTQTAHANVYENRVRLGNLLPDADQEYGGCVTWII